MRPCLLLLLFLCVPFTVSTQILDTLVQVDGQKLHFSMIKGNGTPILFEAGNGEDSSVWEPILQEVHQKTGAPPYYL